MRFPSLEEFTPPPPKNRIPISSNMAGGGPETVEGVYKAGKLKQLKATPESRMKDLVRVNEYLR